MSNVNPHIAAALISLSLCMGGGCASERKVAMAEIPEPVRATLEREAAGTVIESEKETKNGKVVYSFDVKREDGEWDVEIAEDGTLIGKEKEKQHDSPVNAAS